MTSSSQGDLSADDAVELLVETCDAWYACVSECLTILTLSWLSLQSEELGWQNQIEEMSELYPERPFEKDNTKVNKAK